LEIRERPESSINIDRRPYKKAISGERGKKEDARKKVSGPRQRGKISKPRTVISPPRKLSNTTRRRERWEAIHLMITDGL